MRPEEERLRGFGDMVDIEKQVAYWHDAAKEDWLVGCHLVDVGRPRHGLFFAHLALEKILKAHVCLHTKELAPRIHNLIRLREVAALEMDSELLDILADMNAFNIEGRYPQTYLPSPTVAEARAYLSRSEEAFQWLSNQF